MAFFLLGQGPFQLREIRLKFLVSLGEPKSQSQSSLNTEACNHPNCLVIPFSFSMVRRAAA